MLLTLLVQVSADSSRFSFLPQVTASRGVPTGVNFGGWLNLEDWFYSGLAGTHVSTPNTKPSGQGACLPPLATQLEEHWSSEGHLAKKLSDMHGAEKTAEIFMAHRRSFIGTRDLETVRDLGIRTVRVPINWAVFADALAPIDNKTYGAHNPEEDAILVPDPFYSGTAAFVTVPRSWLKMFIGKCHDHGLQVILDMHALPGGSSQGTYNGVWPAPPKFWDEKSAVGDHVVKLTEAGLMITQAMINWVEGLGAKERQAVKGLTLMNEPGHLSAVDGFNDPPWASEEQILGWLAEAGAQFRKSSLPSLGIKLYMNMIETAFKDFYVTVPKWWNKTFTENEQQRWAVMDIHWYTAWGGGGSSGRTVSGGAYYCDEPLSKIRKVLEAAVASHTEQVRQSFGANGLQAISEFSLGTFDSALQACTDKTVLDMFLDVQVEGFIAADIEPFFWSWRMPYGSAFEPGWSLKHAMGKEDVRQALPCQQPMSMTQAQVSSATLEI